MPFPANLDLTTLNGSNGFSIVGLTGASISEFDVAIVRDINGDNIPDYVIGSALADIGAGRNGAVFVLFGTTSGLPSINLGALNGTNGFVLYGAAVGDYAGKSVTSAGDINGDGIGDLLIGTPGNDLRGFNAGAAYVVFGSDTGFARHIPLPSLDGSNGFKLNGITANDGAGTSVSSVGDINGDGLDDLLIGASGASSVKGAAFVVFGSAGLGAGGAVELSSLDGSNGFRINGETYGGAGRTVASAGDFNGDGIGDLIIGAQQHSEGGTLSGSAYVVFGSAAVGAGGTLNLSSLNGANGFQLTGARLDNAGASVASAGDINGDGLDDIVVGAIGTGAGAAFVVFGTRDALPANLSLRSLNGQNGFVINGVNSGDMFGFSVSAAGDLNGDGIDDLLVGAPAASASRGAAYVIYGRTSGFDPAIYASALNGANGFTIANYPGYYVGSSVSGGIDVNGDSAPDIIVGMSGSTTGPNAGAAAFVIYGMPAPIIMTGTAAADAYNGAAGADQLSGGEGNDVLRGMAGDDLLDGGDLSDLLYGGDGADDLVGGLGGDILYGDNGVDELSGGEGNDKLFGGTGADQLNGGTGNDRMAGEADIDTLTGGNGNDYLDGGTGADIMRGGADNDIYIVDDAGDQTIELAGEGYDIVRTTLNWILADNIEGLELQGSTNASGTGNGGSNNLQGNGGNNTLSGLAGVDTINGADGDDIIIGGQGNDLLRGGTGADAFRVEHAFGSVLETDQIYDFSTAENDIMDFRDAYSGTLSVVSAFTRHAGEMTLSFAAGITTVRLDIDGNGQPEYQVKINGDVTGDWAGWLL